ncbi:glycosyltransferase [Anabaena sp. FACHB-709]|uniref:Putative glycosyl transferase n=1 Tax=Trichormus variabilis NIES-23 TaxID=1973479 RepID=A0A1Z4KHQ6_ANAVA|nr:MULTISPECIES: glycosyltransferase [Nostocaceae]BAY68487.1 putative glycosyl transferase [Trichormus variabilis NIES-23]HBW30536.1 glycosyl transferase [Nostoc sp. UBA8866]MBD2264223.1 glycosyltransferase [Anabaena sp. FACHB-709]MBD2273566.1 glycosyltransferase [Nostoc sp. PCC 7120 = FACHB-418]MBD2281693.1 glycosyltransferase [Anabaena cylindrica FACHB-170]
MSINLKILHYIPVYAPAWKFGGPVLSVSRLCEGLAALGHEVEVFTSNAGLENQSELPLNQPVIRNQVKVKYFQQEPGMGINCPGMEQAVTARAKEFDIIHITGVWQRTSGAACKAAKNQGVPYIVSPRGALGPYSWQQKTAKKILYYFWQEHFNVTNAAGVHYTSKQELQECHWLQLPGKSFIVPNGLNTEFWQPTLEGAKAWRKSHNIGEDEFIFLNVGRLHHKKGLDLLSQSLVPLQHLNWRMIFVGSDDDGTQVKLQQQFQSANLSDRVLFLERCEPKELPVIYSAANLFVLPSRHENFGNVVVESLACGCPVLISDKVGLHDEVTEGCVGWVRSRVVSEWTEAIREFIQYPKKMQEVILASRKYVESTYSIKRTALQMANNYFEIINQ